MWLKLLPYIGAIGFLIAVYFWFQNVKQEAYNSGYEQAETEFNEKIAEEEARNRETEASLQSTVDALVNKELEAKTEREVIYRDSGEKITRYITENPYNKECEISPELLAELNRIRDQGPK